MTSAVCVLLGLATVTENTVDDNACTTLHLADERVLLCTEVPVSLTEQEVVRSGIPECPVIPRVVQLPLIALLQLRH